MRLPAVPPDLNDAPPICSQCDYDLRGLTHERCPECGAMIDWAAIRDRQASIADRKRAPTAALSGFRIVVEFVALPAGFYGVAVVAILAENPMLVLMDYFSAIVACIGLSNRWAAGAMEFRRLKDGKARDTRDGRRRELQLRVLLLAASLALTILAPPLALFVYVFGFL